jgi:uncharacterized protein YigA (DUF484 family)
MSTQEATLKTTNISEADVEEFLQDNPQFFESRSELLADMQLPHPSGSAVSLIEYQVRVLREKNQSLEHKLLDLVGVARDNEHLSNQLHHLSLGLLEAEDLDSVLNISQELLRNELKADFVCIRMLGLEEGNVHALPGGEEALAQFEEVFSSNRPSTGRISQEQKLILFCDESDDVASSVLVPLQDPERLGILAIGSRDENRFYPGMGTLFMGTLGELISRAIRSHRGDNG